MGFQILTLLGSMLIVLLFFVCLGVMWNFVYRTFNPPPASVMMDEEYERNVNKLFGRLK